MHDSDEESFRDCFENNTRKKNPFIYETPILQEKIEKIFFVLADVKCGMEKFTHYKKVCLRDNGLRFEEF